VLQLILELGFDFIDLEIVWWYLPLIAFAFCISKKYAVSCKRRWVRLFFFWCVFMFFWIVTPSYFESITLVKLENMSGAILTLFSLYVVTVIAWFIYFLVSIRKTGLAIRNYLPT